MLEMVDKNVEKEEKKELDFFWKYFASYWISSQKMIESWSIWGFDFVDEDFKNRNNNPIERHNRQINELFAKDNPSMC